MTRFGATNPGRFVHVQPESVPGPVTKRRSEPPTFEPTASRAVGSAIGRNAVALVIPCHRVIRGSGEIGEYKWGCARKRTLLDLERAANA